VPEFDPAKIMAVLAKHGVLCVYVGGAAAALQGSPIPTEDVDIVPAGDTDNWTRLSAALTELDAKVRAVELDEPLPFEHDGESLSLSRIWNLTTRYGDLDITQMPAGTQGYDDLKRDAVDMRVAGVHIRVASLADIVRSKEAAGRDKDRRALPVLRELLAIQMREKTGRPPAGPRARKKTN
jgi:hypothetical protein